ncbi:MAG: flap endonuclease [Nitrospirae bacterium]|nr:flap endonuclease [Candidatus Manganitrophaceae bacterium]
MKIHLVDGTYELFRNYFGAPPKKTRDGREIGATLGLLRSLVALLTRPEVTHIACAFDHVIESFRNDLFPGYKTSAGIDPDLLAQFPLAEEATAALGVVVWPMVEFEADDALAAAAAKFQNAPSVEQIVLCSPDKDMTQLVTGSRIVCWDRRRDLVLDAAGVVEKFGVQPHSIPDWLALVGDAADGYPGIPGWGAKSASAVLSRHAHLESIPDDPRQFGLGLGRAARLAESLTTHRAEAILYRQLATLRKDVPLPEKLEELEWRGARRRLKELCDAWGEGSLPKRISRWR